MKYLVARKPNNLYHSLNDFDRIFDNFWSDFSPAPQTRQPKVDIVEDEKGFVLEAELPGFSEKEVEVNIEKHVLTISSTKEEKEEKKDEENSFLVRERRMSSFRRSFVLPEGVAENQIKGEFKNGILTLNIPKLPEEQPKKIEVKIAS